MGFNSNFIGSIKNSFETPTIENHFNEKLFSKHNVPLESLQNYVGDDVVKLELYLVNYIENINTSINLNVFVQSVLESFHNISINGSDFKTFENNDLLSSQEYSQYDSEYINNKIKYLKHFNSPVSGQSKLNSWNNRLCNSYSILKHSMNINFKSHCDHCKDLSDFLDTSYICKLLVLFRILNKTAVLESIFIFIFNQIASFYWNYELLLVTFSNVILKNLVNSVSLTQSTNRIHCLSDTLHSLLVNRNNYLDVKYPHAEILFRILGNFSINISFYYSNLNIYSQNPDNTFVNLFISLILKHIINVSNHSNLNNSLTYGLFGMKTNRQNEFNYLKIFIEAFIKTISDKFKKGYFLSNLSSINTFLDQETYNFIVKLKFKTYLNEIDQLHCRIGVIILYIIAKYNQIPNVRLNEVSDIRLLYSLPWSPAIEYCTTDPKLSHILPDFKKVVIECFGSEIFICNCVYTSYKRILNDFVSGTLANYNKIGYDGYHQNIFYFSNLVSYSHILLINRRKGRQLTFGSETIYYTLANFLVDNCLEIKNSINNTELSKTTKFSKAVESKWISHYLTTSYLFNKSTSYLALLDSLILYYIIEHSSDDGEKLTLDSLYESTVNPDPSLDFQRNISSNFLSLNQNPINLILRIPVQKLVQLFEFRLFGNLLIILVSKLNKYIYEGFSSFLSSTTLQIDLFQLSALQVVSMINVFIDVSKNFSSESVKQFRSFVVSLLSKNPNSYDLILSSGLSQNPCTRFINDLFNPETSFNTSAGNFKHCLRLHREYPNEWDKNDIYSKEGAQSLKTLEPTDKIDVALFHLFNFHLLCLDTGVSKELNDNSGLFLQIEGVVAAFWQFVQTVPVSEITSIIRSSLSLIIKLHYLYPALTKTSILEISKILNMEDITSYSKNSIEEIGNMLKIIEYNGFMVNNKDAKKQ